MSTSENSPDLHKRSTRFSLPLSENKNAGMGQINVFSRNNCSTISPYSRRDFYKISLIIGTGRLHYANEWIYIDKPALLFSNPLIPYSWEPESTEQKGWFCLFTETFVQHSEVSLQDSPVFKFGAKPIYFLDKNSLKEVSLIFEKMIVEMTSSYIHKYSLIRNYLHLIIHTALKLQPSTNFVQQYNASTRISTLFLELLERQFPIDTLGVLVRLKSAQDFAYHLSIHVNHLNRSVKEVTGKTTSEHIALRMLHEACALLQHSDWDISEIGYSLAFEHPSNFNLFFKKHTGKSPNQFRKENVAFA